MNTLSWLLYGAETAEKVGVTAGVAGLIGLGLIPGSFIAAAWVHDFMTEDERVLSKVRAKWKLGLTVTIIASALWAVAPSKQTIMLIAASEVGEQVLSSEQAQTIGGEAGQLATDSLRVLRKFINEQLEGEQE